MRSKIHTGFTRRRFVAGTTATGGLLGLLGALSGCSSSSQPSSSAGKPQVLKDDSQIVDALEDYEQKSLGFTASQTWNLPLGTLLFYSEGDWASAMLAPESASTPNTLGALSVGSGQLATVLATPTKGATYSFFDVCCSTGVYAWIEMDYGTKHWSLLASEFSKGTLTGDVHELDSGDANYDPAPLASYNGRVYWQKMPSLSGNKTANSSICLSWKPGDAQTTKVYTSPGRFATTPRVSDNILTLSPRVLADKGTYYGMTALDVSGAKPKQVDQLVLPSGVRPFEAVYMANRFAFSIEASYDGVGKLGEMGTFIGREGGPYIYVSREPAACVSGKGNRFVIKARSSHIVLDTEAHVYDVIACPDRSLDYGDYPASEGETNQFITFATVKNNQGIPQSVTARIFAL